MAIKVACVQANVSFGDPAANARFAIEELERLADEGVSIAVFPEAFLTGYCVDDAESAQCIAIWKDDDGLNAISEACNSLGILAIVGFAETDGAARYNTAALFEAGQTPSFYRKSHLPELGLDKFVGHGDALPLFDTSLGKIGVLICFDSRFPEAARVLTLKGADLIALPTNWPVGAEVSADHICIARAAENRVFFLACNRVGDENGFHFIGRSKIISPSGKVLAAAGDGSETIVAEVDLTEARQKRLVTIPGKYETDAIGERHPELYGPIVELTS